MFPISPSAHRSNAVVEPRLDHGKGARDGHWVRALESPAHVVEREDGVDGGRLHDVAGAQHLVVRLPRRVAARFAAVLLQLALTGARDHRRLQKKGKLQCMKAKVVRQGRQRTGRQRRRPCRHSRCAGSPS